MQYIPQAAPFIMIDDLILAENEETQTSFYIKEDNLFVENGKFIEAGLIENMAQTAAAGMGYKANCENKLPQVGFIGQIKNLNINELPKVGQTLKTTMRIIHQVMNAFIVEGVVFCEGIKIAYAEYKIFLQ